MTTSAAFWPALAEGSGEVPVIHPTEADGVLYVANERSGDVAWFSVDPESGLPRHQGSVEVPAASCVVVGEAPDAVFKGGVDQDEHEDAR